MHNMPLAAFRVFSARGATRIINRLAVRNGLPAHRPRSSNITGQAKPIRCECSTC